MVGWWSVGLRSWWCRLSLLSGWFLGLSWGLQLWVLHRLLSRGSMLWVGGGVAVMLMLVALVMLLVRVPRAELQVLALLVMPRARALQVMPWWVVLLVVL